MATSSDACSSSAAAGALPTETVDLLCRFQGKPIELAGLSLSCTVLDVKMTLEARTNVLAKRQKLVGLPLISGRPAPDTMSLLELNLGAKAKKLMLVGTPEDQIFVDPAERNDLPEVFDDLLLDMSCSSTEWVRSVENSENLRKFTAKTEVHFITPPRPGKRLLVLDLDHTLLDFTDKDTQQLEALKRPNMDAFLTAVYPHYDLAVWSQTSWRWLEIKLTELGMLTNPSYRICFVLDKTSMFAVTSTLSNGSERRHYVKPLKIIFDKAPQWTEANTLHIDDLGRNFALNKRCGIKVKGYYRSKPGAAADNELILLTRYLLLVVELGDAAPAEHTDWKGALRKL